MMQKYYFILLALFGFGCSSRPVFYQSEPLATVLPDEAGEVQVDGFATLNTDVSGLGATAFYGVTDRFVAGAHFRQIGKETVLEDEFDSKGLLSSYGLKVGYHFPIAKRIRFNLMAEYGLQRQQFYFTEIRSADMRANMAALQTCISMHSGRFRLGYGLRFNRLHYYSSNADVSMPFDYLQEIQTLDEDPTMFFPELGIDIGYMTDHFNLRLGLINRFNNLNNNHFLNGTVVLSAGYSFQTKRKASSE